ncbi:Peroxisomal acyl-coenzyme A oxidase 1 [Smittium mucronatum]|uniref:Acyl-coenzyme A oxidase n=1 Tax=Smittium mucronatum TaxID=133383 RepID=A0A1R0H8U5_9FUNG|nr:Peroxisomal acyl-coenzyme A oxidase 1 [Smittium mucronatum]
MHGSEILKNERSKSLFCTCEMDEFINGKSAVESRKKMLGIIRDGTIDENDIESILEIIGISTPFELQRSLFIPILRQQCNDDQIEAFLKPALDYRILGCIAQTELGHGSNVSGIETTATFIKETDELELNSPTLTSTKWWIGTLGINATHAIVMSQLIINDKRLGVFPVIVPVRNMDDHEPVIGITVGDNGPKMGYNMVDNGFLSLNKVRVPRFNLLQKYINIDKNGKVSRPKNVDPRITYSTMVKNRANIASRLGTQLSKAVTIAVRYTSIRTQFGSPIESPVLDYPIVQYRVIPILAKTYAMIGMSHQFFAQYEKTVQLINTGDFSMLKEMHVVSCGLKRWSSEQAVYGIDTCRHVCGGHGFSMFSGLNDFFNEIYPNIIWEGDNYVLAKQISNYLVKSISGAKKSLQNPDPNDTTNAVYRFCDSSIRLYSWSRTDPSIIANSKDILLDVLGYKFVSMVDELYKNVQFQGMNWDDASIASQYVATAHSEYIVCLYFSRHLSNLPPDSPLAGILSSLFSITALSFLTKNTADLYRYFNEHSSLSRSQIIGLETEYLEKIKSIRDQVVPLVDALGVPEEKLNSSLGRFDGYVYEDYLKRALDNPINKAGTGDYIREKFYDSYISPVLKGSNGYKQKL